MMGALEAEEERGWHWEPGSPWFRLCAYRVRQREHFGCWLDCAKPTQGHRPKRSAFSLEHLWVATGPRCELLLRTESAASHTRLKIPKLNSLKTASCPPTRVGQGEKAKTEESMSICGRIKEMSLVNVGVGTKKLNASKSRGIPLASSDSQPCSVLVDHRVKQESGRFPYGNRVWHLKQTKRATNNFKGNSAGSSCYLAAFLIQCCNWMILHTRRGWLSGPVARILLVRNK